MMHGKGSNHCFAGQIMNEPCIDQKVVVILGTRPMHHVGPQVVGYTGISVGLFHVSSSKSTSQKRNPNAEAVRNSPFEAFSRG